MSDEEKMLLIELTAGMIILLGGLLTYGLGINNILPVPRPDLAVCGTALVGIILILAGSDLLSKKTKAEETFKDSFIISQKNITK